MARFLSVGDGVAICGIWLAAALIAIFSQSEELAIACAAGLSFFICFVNKLK